MNVRRVLPLLLVLGVSSLVAQSVPDTTLTITMSGTLGPVLSGSDPLGANGQTGTLVVMASESLSPTSSTATSATYTLPPGAITVTIGTTTYTTSSKSTMKITVPPQGKDNLILTANLKEVGLTITAVGTAALRNGSFPLSVLVHPTTFQPSPQPLTAAATATGPGSKLKYTFLGSTSVLGFTGTASDNAAADAVLPQDDSVQ